MVENSLVFIIKFKKGEKIKVNMRQNIMKQIFRLNKRPVNMEKVICAAISGGFPILVGILLGNIRYGLIASIGGFTYLYLFNEPYARRAKKILFAGLGITSCVGLGLVLRPYPMISILIIGLIGFFVTFVFSVLKMIGPATIFFVMSFSMVSNMNIKTSQIPIVIALVFLSSVFSWILSMIGYLFNPHGPEINKVKQLYLVLAEFAQSIGTKNVDKVRNKTVNILKETEEMLIIAYIPWKKSFLFNKLFLLNQYANNIFLELVKVSSTDNKKVPEEILKLIKQLSNEVNLYCNKNMKNNSNIELDKIKVKSNNKYYKVLQIVYDIESIINLPLKYIGNSLKIEKPSVILKFAKSINKDSIILFYSIRCGIVLAGAAFVAYKLGLSRSYWTIMSCAAVMYGPTIEATLHRAIQRSVGTIAGLGFSLLILSFHPQGIWIVILNMCLTACIELTIGKNYALGAVFFTANAILIAENSSQIYDLMYFANARLTNIVVGSLIGFIGTYIISFKSASKRVPILTANLLMSHARALTLLNYNNKKEEMISIKERISMDFMNLEVAYTAALGEFSRGSKKFEMFWPAFSSLEHMSYLLSYFMSKNRLNLSDEDLSKLVLIYIRMANDIEQGNNIKYKEKIFIEEIPEYCNEFNMLQEALHIDSKVKYSVS